MTERRKERLALAATTVASLLLVFWPNLLLGQVFVCRDMGRMHFPVKVFLREQLLHGHFPLWYPYDGLGVPFIASSHTSVFHPLTLLEVALPPDLGLMLATVVTVVVAIIATWRLARRLGLSLTGAAAATAVFAVGGPFIANVHNITYLWGAAGFPLVLLGLDGVARGPSRRWGIAVAGLAIALAILAGDIEAAYIYGLVGLPFVLIRRDGKVLPAVLRTAAAGALGLAVAAVQILPSLAILPTLDRARALPWAIAADWSLNWLRIPDLFFGDLLHLVPALQKGQVVSLLGFGNRPPWLIGVYLGPLPLLGLAWILSRKSDPARRRLAIALVAITGVLLWLALGNRAGLYHLAYDVLPLWNRWRYPQKAVPFAALCLAIIAGLGVTEAFAKPMRAARIAVVLGIALLVLAGLGALFPHAGAILAGHLAAPDANPAKVPASAATYVHRLIQGLFRGGLLTLAAAALLVLGTRRNRLAIAAPVLLVGLVLADLTSQSGRLITLCSADRWVLNTPSDIAMLLRKQFGPSLGHYRVTPATGRKAIVLIGHGLGNGFGDDVNVAGGTLWDLQALDPDFSGLAHVETTAPYLPAVTRRYLHLLVPNAGRWVTVYSPEFNSRFVVTSPQVLTHSSLPRRFFLYKLPGFNLAVARQPGALPRAFVAEPVFVEGEAGSRAALEEPAVRSGFAAAVESKARGGPYPARSTLTPAKVVSDRPGRVVIQTPAGPPGVLVLNDAYFPEWRATVDGKPVHIVRANDLVRGVLLPAGAHRVVFRYPVPTPLIVGGGVSVLGLALVLWLWISDRRRRESSAGPEALT